MKKYKLTLSYDGTNYSGWQIQPNGISIQEMVEKALKIILKKETKLVGSGRTDAGVHASAQVAHFSSEAFFNPVSLLYSLNGLLPNDIRIKEIEKTDPDFHARYSAVRKIYRYYFHLKRTHSPFKYLYSTHIRTPLDLILLKKALKFFIGTHDFTSFSNQAHRGSAAKNPIKTLYHLNLIEESEGICLEFIGNGFLYKMVRNIVGTLLEIATKKRPLESIPLIFSQKDRRAAAPAAPPQGLFLTSVLYN